MEEQRLLHCVVGRDELDMFGVEVLTAQLKTFGISVVYMVFFGPVNMEIRK
jgi:hypothetical protein